MNEFHAFENELRKLADVDDMRLKQPATYVKPISPAPPNPTFQVKAGFAQSGFSGVMNLGAFPSASAIPSWREPPLERVKTSGPPPDSAKLEGTSEDGPPDGRAHLKKDAAMATTPQGRLQSTQATGGPRMSAPGPSIAEQSKPKGFGTALPGLAKMSFAMPNLSTMHTIAGGALGAASGSIAGRALADEGEGGRGALKGALVGGALGAAGGHVLPRVQSRMATGMKPVQALRAVGNDMKGQIHAATATRVPPPSTLHPTEVGSAQIAESYKNLSPHLRGALENSSLVKAGVPPEMAMQLAYMSRNKSTGESAVGSIARHAVGGGATPPALKSGPRLVSMGERNIPTNMATNMEAGIPTNVEAMRKIGRLWHKRQDNDLPVLCRLL